MAATRKMMFIKEEKAVVQRERHVYRVDAEAIEGGEWFEMETDLKETIVAKKEIRFTANVFGELRLTLAQGVDPATVKARGDVAVKSRAAAVSQLEEEPWRELEEYLQDSEGRARIGID